jgi:two-component system sensor histidine kinase MprB
VPLDVRDAVEAALERVGRRSQGAIFDVELAPLFVVADPEAFVRVVTNLLDNAVKWSPPGGTIRVRLEGNRLTVSDAGPGIPEADLPYVFDRFFRGDSARHTKGTGLGLAIVAKTVGEMGGKVEAGRSPEGGAEFTLQLPGVTSREAVSDLLVTAAG